jgi:N4-(beta-N-acetylglucosaminyl)-L-asparaginase
MVSRRFILGALGLSTPVLARTRSADSAHAETSRTAPPSGPLVVSTWDFGVPANKAAWAVLSAGGRAIDAVEAGARVPEADLKNHTVGRAGYPDRDGHVTLDASIMDEFGNCGAVAAMELIAHPISVARRVMDKTPHVLLVGEGATRFAVEQGFVREELLTPEAREAWEKWRQETSGYKPVPNRENKDYDTKSRGVVAVPGGAGNHDTLGMLAIDRQGNLAGACTLEACREAVRRIVQRKANRERDFQVGFLAISRAGEIGAWAVQKGFTYAVCDSSDQGALHDSHSFND